MNFFVDKSSIRDGHAVVDGEEFSHITRVLRMRSGSELTLCDGEGMFYDGVISSSDDRRIYVDITDVYPAQTEPKLKITLFQAVPKNPKLELIIRKTTEIGVTGIVPVKSARTVAKLENGKKLERLQKIALSAAKQSRRGIIPEVTAPVSFETAVKLAAEKDLAVIPYEEERATSFGSCLRGKAPSSLAIMIGPEGGFEEAEIELARENGILPATLGKRILRTETAGLIAAAIALYELGEME